MKKILFASAFALMGTFAMANEAEVEQDDLKLESELLKYCVPVTATRCNYSITIIDCESTNALELVVVALELYDDMEALCD